MNQDPIGLWGDDNFYTFAPNIQEWIDPLGFKKKKKIRFSLFRDHATRHGKAANMSPAQYRKSAESHLGCSSRKVKFRHDGKTKLAHITKIGEDRYMFTSSNLSRNRIFTHMPEGVSSKYLSNIGISI